MWKLNGQEVFMMLEFANSDINKMFQNKQIPMVLKELLPGDDKVPPVILGDPAYPLLPNVMRPSMHVALKLTCDFQ
jgi:hypothetical protein